MSEQVGTVAIGVVLLLFGIVGTLFGFFFPLVCIGTIPMAIIGLILIIVGATSKPQPTVAIYNPYPVQPMSPAVRFCESCGRPMAYHAPSGKFWCGSCGRWAEPIRT